MNAKMDSINSLNKSVIITRIFAIIAGMFLVFDTIYTLLNIGTVKSNFLLFVTKDSIGMLIGCVIFRSIIGLAMGIFFIIFTLLRNYKKPNYFILALLPWAWACIRAFEMNRIHNSFPGSYLEMMDVVVISSLIIFSFYQAKILAGIQNKNDKIKLLVFGVLSGILILSYNIIALIKGGNFSIISSRVYISEILVVIYLLSLMISTISSEHTEEETPPAVIKSSFEWLSAIEYAVVVVVIIFTFAIQNVVVSGDSMKNTLYDRDKLILTNFMYEPKDGDIVVVNERKVKEKIIKRVIATEGQTLNIDFDNNKVYVDGKLLDENYTSTKMPKPEDLRGMKNKYGNTPSVIPEGYVFVMGDNRANSLDSRFEAIGLIDKKDVMGKAIFRWGPFSRLGAL